MVKTFCMGFLVSAILAMPVFSEDEKEDLEKEILQMKSEMDSIKSEIEEQKKLQKESGKKRKLSKLEKLRQERADSEPYQVKRPRKVTYGFRITSVGPYDDESAHILATHGLGFMGYLNEHIAVGIQELTIDVFNTINGNRFSMSVSPEVEISFCPIKWLQMGTEVGVTIAGHASHDEDPTSAVVPFLSVFNQYWVLPKFSFGPEVQLNAAFKGDHHLNSLSSNRSSMIPEKGVWIDAGLQFSFHF